MVGEHFKLCVGDQGGGEELLAAAEGLPDHQGGAEEEPENFQEKEQVPSGDDSHTSLAPSTGMASEDIKK